MLSWPRNSQPIAIATEMPISTIASTISPCSPVAAPSITASHKPKTVATLISVRRPAPLTPMAIAAPEVVQPKRDRDDEERYHHQIKQHT
jgi:hypothetical protein